MAEEYNLVVFGATPAGRMAAIKAAMFGHKVALIDDFECKVNADLRLKRLMFKMAALEEADELPAPKVADGEEGKPGEEELGDLSVDDQIEALLEKGEEEMPDPNTNAVYRQFIKSELAIEKEFITQMKMLQVKNLKLLRGKGHFLNIDEVEVEVNERKQTLDPSNVIIAMDAHVSEREFGEEGNPYLYDARRIFEIEQIPRRLLIVGSGKAGLQFATAFAHMGSKVTVVDEAEEILPFLDGVILKNFRQILENKGIDLRLGSSIEEYDITEVRAKAGVKEVTGRFSNGDEFAVDMILWAEDREGPAADVNAKAAGVNIDEDNFIEVDENFRSSVPHIYAVGESAYAPGIECMSIQEGRQAVTFTFGLKDTEQLADDHPIIINTFPQIAYYGWTEEDLKENGISYAVGQAMYADTHVGRRLGLDYGLLRLFVSKDTEEIMGVHIVGRQAAELIQLGMALVEGRTPVANIAGSVINSHSFHELYLNATLNVLGKMKHRPRQQ